MNEIGSKPMICWYCRKDLGEGFVEYTLPSRKKRKKILKMHVACHKAMNKANGRKTIYGGMRG